MKRATDLSQLCSELLYGATTLFCGIHKPCLHDVFIVQSAIIHNGRTKSCSQLSYNSSTATTVQTASRYGLSGVGVARLPRD